MNGAPVFGGAAESCHALGAERCRPQSFEQESCFGLLEAKIKDPLSRETTLTYNNRNWVETVTTPDPDGGGSLNPLVYSYEYDFVGNLETLTMPLAREIVYGYDYANRVTSVLLPMLENGQTPKWVYSYDAVGNLKDQEDPFGTNGKTEFIYDDLHRLKRVIQPRPDGVNGQQDRPEWKWNYNERGLLSSTTDPLNRTTIYGHDFGGRMSEMYLPGDTKQRNGDRSRS